MRIWLIIIWIFTHTILKRADIYLYGKVGIPMERECKKYINTCFKVSERAVGKVHKDYKYQGIFEIDGYWEIHEMYSGAHSIEQVSEKYQHLT